VTDNATTKCPACGAAATGRFCNSCGAALTAGTCRSCGQALLPGVQFCRGCGASAGAGASPLASAPRADRAGWVAAGGAGVALLGVLIAFLGRGEPRGATAGGSAAAPLASGDGAPSGTPPDISNMTPKERYDRLYNRVMRAAETGDQATVAQFTPMTMTAYQQLDSVDADARFHMAMLLLHTGQVPGAAAEGDSILKTSPGHLFGYMIQGTVARWNKDTAGLKKAQQQFLARYDTEMKAKRQEYAEHERALNDFRAAALGQAPAKPGAGS